LVRDDRQISRKEVPRLYYFNARVCGTNKRLVPYCRFVSPLTGAAWETLYTREGEDKEAAEIIEIISNRFPKTYFYLYAVWAKSLKTSGDRDVIIKNVLRNNFSHINTHSGLIEISDERYRIPEKVRRTRLIPDVLVRSVA
jgi:hypothetical protein